MISNRIEDLPVPVSRNADGTWRLVVDIAVLGHTDAADDSGRIGPRGSQAYFGIDVRGDSYFVESLVYPGGTIPTPTVPTRLSVNPKAPPRLNNELVWDFTRAKPIGHHFNRGWVLINGEKAPGRDTRGTIVEQARTAPHLLSTHNLVLGIATPELLTPPMLVTAGMENGNDPDAEEMMRAVKGGTGPFRFARGACRQQRIGRNSTRLRTFSKTADVFAPNYRFTFTLKL
jgi:hypothetical protein